MRIFLLSIIFTILFGLRVNAEPFAYITNSMDDTVSVINVATNNVIATVPVGPRPTSVATSSNLGTQNPAHPEALEG